MTTVCAIRCPNCKDWIYSRACHDMRYCTCSEVAIDGGFEYVKISTGYGVDPHKLKSKKLRVKATKKQLYDDWNIGKDVYGLIQSR